eukprot:TRINITY_DN6678_c2_g1_i1.p4 TRINITY_DN6678_c2_g1~~TRINITY_DN6678_c2_g1_i1.p4  ORF type:complete len:182 (-),score=5.09 TRINITY_DN6678_c2_g1_i1:266-811(-)
MYWFTNTPVRFNAPAATLLFCSFGERESGGAPPQRSRGLLGTNAMDTLSLTLSPPPLSLSLTFFLGVLYLSTIALSSLSSHPQSSQLRVDGTFFFLSVFFFWVCVCVTSECILRRKKKRGRVIEGTKKPTTTTKACIVYVCVLLFQVCCKREKKTNKTKTILHSPCTELAHRPVRVLLFFC